MNRQRAFRIDHWAGLAILSAAILASATAWSLPRGPSLQILSQVALATLDDIVDLGRECSAELGKEVPDFDCVTDGEVLKTTKGDAEVEITDTAPDTKCNRPALLGYDGGNQCSPYSRLIKKVDGEVVTQIFCRRYQVRPRDDKKFDDVNIIQTNTRTGKTCWFNSKLAAQDASPAPPPYRAAWGADAAGDAARAAARGFWYKASDIANIKCMSCHDSDLWIHTPYVDQATTPNKVTQNPFHKDIENVGSQFAPGMDGWKLRKRMMVQTNYFLKAFPLTPQEKALVNFFGKIASEGRCTQCHTIGESQTCAYFAKHSMARIPDSSLSAPFNAWSKNHWMPTNGRESLIPSPVIPDKVISDESYSAYYTRTLKALEECCLNPDLEREFAGENLGLPIKLCQRDKPIGVAKLGNPNFKVIAKGPVGHVGIVSMNPTLRSDYDDYPTEGFGGSPWTCPLNGDYFATGDEYGRTQVTEVDIDGNMSVTCLESNEYVEFNGAIVDGVLNRYEISATPPCSASVFTGFSDVCTGTDPCIQENWYDTVLTANFAAAPDP